VPTYEYRCKACGDETEVVQSFTDDALTTCAVCGGPLRKLFGNVGIAFKGSGFYKNDSRGKAPATAGKNGAEKSTADSGTSSADKTSSDSGSSSNGDAASGAKKEPAKASSGAAKSDAPKSSDS
jgi:putative FmdB family regulatory protein